MPSSSEKPSTDPFTFWHPASLIATFFGTGKSPFAPGTCGSLAAFPFLYALASLALSLPVIKNNYEVYSRFITLTCILLLCVAVLFFIGIWASAVYVKNTHKEDPGEVVIDEVVGQSLTFLLVLPSVLLTEQNPVMMFIIAVIGSFALFRFFDIKKPWPINWCDKNIKGGIGIMFDDVVAAIMASVFYYALLFPSLDAVAWLRH